MAFSSKFVWGAATASFQIEGASHEDGKGQSIWDEFCQIPGAVFEGHTGDVACDHYHLYSQDIALMKEIGIKAYRFSFSWPRIIPDGTGAVNESGLKFYDKLVNELIANGIEPCATLYHWDYPAVLQKKGGWLNPESPYWFEHYAEVIAKHFSGRIKCYFTINEPQCFIGLGYCDGKHAPGLKYGAADGFACVHNVLLAHGLAVKALRTYGGSLLKIGSAQNGNIYIPNSDRTEDLEAAQKATFSLPDNYFEAITSVALWSDPIFKGDYPAEFYTKFADALPVINSADMGIISQPVDFCAQNIYSSIPVISACGGYEKVTLPAGTAKNAMGWPIIQDSLYWCSKLLYRQYGKPIVISENGMAAHDAVSLDGKVHDPNRIDYINRYLLGLKRAADEGVDISAYFYWSLMDNFEWSFGYNERFGLIYTDFATKRRIIKDSAYWYRNIIESNGEKL